MGATNKTTYYGLPQWIDSDKPTFLGDLNSAFANIDSGIHGAKETADSVTEIAINAEEKSTQAYEKSVANETNVNSLLSRVSVTESSLNEQEEVVNGLVSSVNVLNNVSVAENVTLTKESWVESSVDSRYGYSITVPVNNKFDEPFSTIVSDGLLTNEVIAFNNTIEQFIYNELDNTITFFSTVTSADSIVDITLAVRG